ncbi:MAG TPA: MBL fold metallo-hydrolase [Usitatibacter sp.]|nr:MBL fold metallo-hydrolase [Usitatibacter sp.]
MLPSLPPSVRVIVRGWLNCNQVVLLAPGDNVLIDSGYCTHREETLELLASRMGLDRQPLERLVNTHCHSDHMGGNAAVASAYGCRVTIPAGEVKNVRPWTPQSAWMEQFDQRADPFHFDDTLAVGDTFEAGGFTWEVHAAPGHDMDALMFFEPANRLLVSGDALWENGMGFVWPANGPNPHIEAAREALATIERLDPAVVIPGHGAPFANVAAALASVRGKLDAFERDPVKCARHVVKVMFAFALLDRGSMAVGDVPAYLDTVPCYSDMSRAFLQGQAGGQLATWMLADLARAGAIQLRDGVARPAIPA